MNLTGSLPRNTRLEKSIAALEAEWAEKERAPIGIANDFINTTDASNFEERLSQLSTGLCALIEKVARNNVLAFDAIIEECIQRRGYPDGWRALRDWTRRQSWHDEAVERMKEGVARWPPPSVETEEERAAKAKEREEFEEFLREVDRDQRARETKE